MTQPRSPTQGKAAGEEDLRQLAIIQSRYIREKKKGM